ncbi:hemoglobin subunit alpha-D-like [Tiliqua scincoides]|uniref:hemoglobin subunit alpha-D-like n=1 Tax=Tiliqua scincoides TaxID=71010 RepID=UPI0034635ACD
MVLTASDRQVLQSTWGKVSGCDDIAAEILERLFLVYPATKTYFPHFNLARGSSDVRHQGQKIVKALDSALKHLDNLRATLADLADLHAYNLRVDPVNFKLLAKCIHVTLATHLRGEYSALATLAWDKLLAEVSEVLCEKYR